MYQNGQRSPGMCVGSFGQDQWEGYRDWCLLGCVLFMKIASARCSTSSTLGHAIFTTVRSEAKVDLFGFSRFCERF